MTDEAWKAVEEVDAEGVFASMLDGSQGVFINQGDFHVSRDSVIASTRRAFRYVQREQINVGARHIFVLSPTSAVVSEQGQAQVVLVTGDTVATPYALTLVFAKQEHLWHMIHGHQSFPSP